MTIRPADIGKLTVPISAIAAIVAMQGGSTFQTNIFSTVKTAFDVAVIRLVSIPGNRSENYAADRARQLEKNAPTQSPGPPQKCEAGRPAGDPPQKIIRCDQ